MNYSKYISFPSFHPVCDITNEQDEHWTTFIPNECFHGILDDLIKSLQSSAPKDHKSFWIQGSYGSGKSHAAIVFKHLLCDDFAEIEGHAHRLAGKPERFARFQKLRASKRYLPVILKGAEKAYHARGAANYIKTGVKKSLDQYGIDHHLQTDFDSYINLLSDREAHNWENVLFAEGSELSFYTRSVDAVIEALKKGDVKYLELVENACASRGWGAVEDSVSIVEWLREAELTVRNNGFSGIIIFWDEMTSLFRDNQLDEAVLELIQKIAEVTFSAEGENPTEIYLYMISHKNLSNKNEDKIGDRFIRKQYAMEFVTTYSILSHLIGREVHGLQDVKYEFRKKKDVCNLLDELESDSGSSIVGDRFLDSLFPLHPYSAYLCTLIAKNFGSTNRSVFKFIYDEKHGFNAFIKEKSIPEACTSDYLWRFFEEDFREDLALYGDVLQVHQRYSKGLKKEQSYVSQVFEVVLLLNALAKRSIGDELAIPSEKNICKAFAGVYSQSTVIDALKLIHDRDIISQNAMGLYLVESSSLPREDLNKEETKLRAKFANPAAIINDSDFMWRELQEQTTAQLFREKDFDVMDMSTPQGKSKVTNSINNFTSGHKIKFFLIPCWEGKVEETKNTYLSEVNPQLPQRNAVIVIPREPLSEKIYSNWIKYKAKEAVSAKRGLPQEADDAKNNADSVLRSWLQDITGSAFYVNYGNDSFEEAASCSEIVDIINTRMRKPRFAYGAEQYPELLKKQNAWKKGQVPAVIKAVINASNRDELTKSLPAAFSPLMCVLRSLDNIDLVGNDLKFSPNCPTEAPLWVIKEEIDRKLSKKKQGGLFNLDEALVFLTKPPYGFYQNAVSQFILAFCLREYAEQLFSNEGFPIGKAQLQDVIKAVFSKWEGGSDKKKEAEIRFGSEEENKFNEQVSTLFDLTYSPNTQNTIGALKLKFSSRVGAPLWVMSYFPGVDGNTLEDYIQFIDFIQKGGKLPTQKEFKTMNSILERRFTDFKLLLTPDNFQKAFDLFIVSVLALRGEEHLPIEEVKQYLPGRMQEDYGYWEESKTKIAILSFRPEPQQTPIAPPSPEEPTVVPSGEVIPVAVPTTSTANHLTNRIREHRLSEDEYVKCLTELVDRYPVVHSYLMSIFRDARN